MPPLAFIIILVLMNWWSFRAIRRYLAGRRRPAGPRLKGDALPSSTGLAAVAMDGAAGSEESDIPQPRARAFPVQGLLPGSESSGVLEGLLRHVAGVTRAYVSPITSLAYVDYLPALVTEEQLVGAIRSGGYLVGVAAQRFDWRHGHPA